jgi:hypothetical protein
MRKQKKELELSGAEFRSFILSNLMPISDIQLLIIKGHILIEYSLNKYISRCSSGSFDINSTSFSFFNTIQIADALGLFLESEPDTLKEQIKIISTLRNEIAHQMSFNKNEIKSLINTFLSDTTISNIIKKKKSDLDILKSIIVFICGQVNGRMEAQVQINKMTRSILSEKLKK